VIGTGPKAEEMRASRLLTSEAPSTGLKRKAYRFRPDAGDPFVLVAGGHLQW